MNGAQEAVHESDGEASEEESLPPLESELYFSEDDRAGGADSDDDGADGAARQSGFHVDHTSGHHRLYGESPASSASPDEG